MGRRLLVLSLLLAGTGSAQELSVSMSVSPEVSAEPVTGRMLLLISQRPGEPRLLIPFTFAYYFNEPVFPYPQVFGQDVDQLASGEEVVFDGSTLGYPFDSLSELEPGTYTVQALLNVYTQFERSDGHTIWAHMDQGEGQQFHISPGNLYSDPERVTLDPGSGIDLSLELTNVIPPIPPIPDSEHVRRIRIQSELISEFWGRDMFVTATAILPKGYDENPDVHYPVLYYHGHFFENPAFGFPEDIPAGAREAKRLVFPNQPFKQAWLSSEFPRMIIVTFEHPTPYYDDSYFVDSANNGPWGRAFLEEVLPAVEEEWRIIPEAWARVMTGGSTGGWVSAALQIYHPDVFGGAWSFCPDPVDFREFLNMNIYADENAFFRGGHTWKTPERYLSRTVKGYPRVTVRQGSQFSRVFGSKSRSGEFLDMWNAIYGPVGDDGYPVPLWDHETGVIDKEVAEYWRDQGFDLRHYLEENWEEIGPDLVGKLHFLVGDMDDFYLNLAVYRMEAFLEKTKDPEYGGSFYYGRPMVGHTFVGYQQDYPMAFLGDITEHIAENAPDPEAAAAWHYP